jgi:multiple sugar transport system substrate-binding protein
MKNLYRTVALILFACALALTFSACHGHRKIERLDVPGATYDENGELLYDPDYEIKGEYEITFWAKNDTNLVQRDIYLKAAEAFHELYPNITVHVKMYTDYGMIFRDVKTNIITNTTPNLCISYPDHIATYLTGENIVVPLDDLMNNPYYGLGGSKLKFDGPSFEELVPQYISECVVNGAYYALPFMRSTEALYVNKTYVERLGYTLPDMVTWDFVWEVSEAALAKNDDGTYKVSGKNVLMPFIYKSSDNMMIQMLKQLGADYSTDKGEVLIFNDTTRKLMLDISPHAKNKAFSIFTVTSYPGNWFNAGECIFAIDSTAGATWMGSNSPLKEIPEEQVVEFETVTLPIPQFDVNDPKMISQGPSMCIFNKDDPDEVLATWLFAQFLLTNEVQNAYSRTEGYVPVTFKAQQSEEYQNYLSRSGEDNDDYYYVKIDAAKMLLANQQYTFITPVFDGSASLREAAGQMIDEVVLANNRKQTVDDEFVTSTFERVSTLKKLDQIKVSGGKEGKQELGKLPAASVALLIVLPVVWVILGAFYLKERLAEKKKQKEQNK